jgi:hypothetical protein
MFINTFIRPTKINQKEITRLIIKILKCPNILKIRLSLGKYKK